MKSIFLAIISISAFILFLAFLNRNDMTSTSQQMLVGPVTQECIGGGPRRCLQVKYHPDEKYQNFYAPIEGFDFVPGYEYLLEVATQEIINPPADASSLQYYLVEILDQRQAQYIMITDPTDHQSLNTNSPITVTGTGRGLFEGNVVIQVEDRQKQEIIAQEITTMSTEVIGDEGSWRTTFTLSINQDIQGGLKAFSPSPKDGSTNVSYSLPVTFSTLDGKDLSLENTNWQLQSYRDDTITQNLSQALPQTTITANFDGTQVGGSSGCNQYFAPYTTQGNQINIGPSGSTLKACPDPIMNQEQQYLSQLQSSDSYRIEGDILTMYNLDRETTLTFEVAPTIALESTPWQAQGINNGTGGVVSNATSSLSTALFQDGTVSGNTGCNDYHGSYQADETSINIGPLSTTRKACAAELMAQEQEFLSALQNSNRYQIMEDRLNLRQNQSTMVNFEVSKN